MLSLFGDNDSGKKRDFAYRKPNQDNINAIVSFLPLFEGPESGLFQDRYQDYGYTSQVAKFIDALHDEGFIFGFDWQEWMHPEGFKYLKDSSLIQKADILTIQKLLTSIIRFNRMWSSPPGDKDFLRLRIKDGTIVKILRRLYQLKSEKT